MRNNKVWYIGYLIGLCSLLLLFTQKFDESINIVLTLIFAISVSVSNVKIMHNKLLKKNTDYRINIKDERNEKIRDKVNANMASILTMIMGIIAVVCIAVKAYLPAGLLALSVALSPIIMFFLSKYYERKY